jgi:protein involved in polysaccharide export with SLBB domain
MTASNAFPVPPFRRAAPAWVGPALLLVALTGCAGSRPHVDRALLADGGGGARNLGVAENYTIGCPDVLDVAVAGRPDLSGPRPVGPDGTIDLGPAGPVRVEGRTPPEAAARIAGQAHVPTAGVRVGVAQFNSQEVYLSGPGVGVPRAVPYRGQETVLDMLQRVGGVTPSAAPEDVYVVRSHVAEGERPEVFHIDLRGIVMKRDQHTNLRLQPFDQVHVGETRQGRLDKVLPPWLRPLYQACWGIAPLQRDASVPTRVAATG